MPDPAADLPSHGAHALHHHQKHHRKADLAPQPKPAEPAQKQRRKADQRNRDRQKRLGDPGMRLEQQLPGLCRRFGKHLGAGPDQLRGQKLRHAAAVADRPGQERTQIIGEIGKPRDRDALILAVQRLRHAVEHDQLGPRISPHEQRLAGGVGGAFVGLARILQEQAAQLARGVDLVDIEGDALARMGKDAVGQKPRRDVLGQGGAFADHGRAAHRHQNMHQYGHHQCHHQPEYRHRPRHAKRRKPGRLHHHKLAFHRQLVGDIDRRHKPRDRQNQLDHIGQRQQREFHENHRRLAIAHQLVKQHHRPVDPVDTDQNKGEKAEMHKHLRRQVAVESWHCPLAPVLACPDASGNPGRGKLISGHFPDHGLALGDAAPSAATPNWSL